MCGRYGRTSPPTDFAKIVDAVVSQKALGDSGYNQPPGTFQLCALKSPDTGEIKLGSAWWGFIPNWATDTKLAPINARSETAMDKKLFAKSFAHQRCLVAADWWYEWQRDGDRKQPFAIRPEKGGPFFFAGLWSKAARLPADHPAAGQVTYAILTGDPNEDIAHIHNRQPQALTADAARAWLNDSSNRDLHEILSDGRYQAYESWPVSTRVGNPSNDDAAVIERINL